MGEARSLSAQAWPASEADRSTRGKSMSKHAAIQAALALAFLSVSTFGALAEDAAAPAGPGKRFAACATEIGKFCANVEKGKGLMRKCLDEHTADLSDGCKARLAEHDAAKAKDAAPQ
jgi:hypothetical protein